MIKRKNQHWVPQLYLKHFATDDSKNTGNPKIWFTDVIRKKNSKLSNIKNIAAKNWLYSPENEDGKRNYSADDRLFLVESISSKIWPAFAQSLIPFVEEDDFPPDYNFPKASDVRKLVSMVIGDFYLRNPSLKNLIISSKNKFINNIQKIIDNNPGRTGELIVTLGDREYSIDIKNWNKDKDSITSDNLFLDGIENNPGQIWKIIHDKKWHVYISDEPVFLTSDNPVSILGCDGPWPGLKSDEILIVFPISPYKSLFIGDEGNGDTEGYYKATPEIIAISNKAIEDSVIRFLISKNPIS